MMQFVVLITYPCDSNASMNSEMSLSEAFIARPFNDVQFSHNAMLVTSAPPILLQNMESGLNDPYQFGPTARVP